MGHPIDEYPCNMVHWGTCGNTGVHPRQNWANAGPIPGRHHRRRTGVLPIIRPGSIVQAERLMKEKRVGIRLQIRIGAGPAGPATIPICRALPGTSGRTHTPVVSAAVPRGRRIPLPSPPRGAGRSAAGI